MWIRKELGQVHPRCHALILHSRAQWSTSQADGQNLSLCSLVTPCPGQPRQGPHQKGGKGHTIHNDSATSSSSTSIGLPSGADRAHRWFATHEGWLLICDNADDVDAIGRSGALTRALPPLNAPGHVLLTSRIGTEDFGSLGIASPLTLGLLELSAAERLLLSVATGLDEVAATEHLTTLDSAEREAVAWLVGDEGLARLPLAILQAGSAIKEDKYSFADYRLAFGRRRVALLANAPAGTQREEQSVLTTWDISIEALQRKSPAAAELLALCAPLAPDDIPIEIFNDVDRIVGEGEGWRALRAKLQAAADDDERRDVIQQQVRAARKYSLIEWDGAKAAVSMHRLVKEVQWRQLGVAGTQRRTVELLGRLLEAAIPKLDESSPLIEANRAGRTLPHVAALLKSAARIAPTGLLPVGLLNAAMSAHHQRGERAAQLMMAEVALREVRAARGEVAVSSVGVQMLAYVQLFYFIFACSDAWTWDVNEPETFTMCVLPMSLAIVGATILGVMLVFFMKRMACLSVVVLGKAGGIFIMFLVRDIVLTTDDDLVNHRNMWLLFWLGTAAFGILCSLVALCFKELVYVTATVGVGSYVFASSIAGIILACGGTPIHFGWYILIYCAAGIAGIVAYLSVQPEHPDTLASMHNLGNALGMVGRYDDAVKMLRTTLELNQRVLGKEDRQTLSSMNGLAIALSKVGQHVEAVKMLRTTLEARRRVLGEEHQDTLDSMNALANALNSAGQHAEAAEMHRRALEAMRRVLGEEHPRTLSSMNNLANALSSAGQHAEAVKMLRTTLELKQRLRGKEHPDTLTSMNGLACALNSAGQHDEAVKMHRTTLELKQRVLGKEDPDTLSSMNNLATALYRAGQHAEAVKMLRTTIELKQRVLREEHPDTLTSMDDLACALESAGQYAEAEEMHRTTLEARRRVLGEEHPDTRDSMRSLAMSKMYRKIMEVSQARTIDR